MLMIPKVYQSAYVDPHFMPDPKAMAEMGKYNESLQKAGILLTLDGLAPPTAGARVSFKGGKPSVIDGPFAEAKELVGGYWIIQVKSKEEAVEWARRCPATDGDIIEIRQIFDMADYPPDAQKAAGGKRLGA
jgi:hypothetical protein